MMYRLIVLTGPLKGQRITVDTEPMTLGRSELCSITLPDNEVAVQHAQLEQHDAELIIRDLGSMNKVMINKREVREARLKHGDIVELGRTRLLVEAIVQAEVQHPQGVCSSRPLKKMRRKRFALAALAVAAIGLTLLTISRRDAAKPTPMADDSPANNVATEIVAEEKTVEETPIAIISATAPTTAPLDDELRRIREDLQFIQQHISVLNQSAQPLAATERITDTSTGPVTQPEGKSDDLQTIMSAIQKAIEASDFTQADMMLEHVQLEYPNHLPAYEIRAELYESWGMPGKAREQWAAILQRTTESEIYRKAIAERIRLNRVESQRLNSAHEAVRIQSVEQFRFRESAEYDEMRLIKVGLNYNRELGPVDPGGVRLLIYFFEQDMDTRHIELSSLQPFVESHLKDWQNEKQDQFTISASYVIPKGYYDTDHNTRRQRYFGFIARLHYFDRLIDEQARPPKLLEPAILEAAGLALHTAAGNRSINPAQQPATN